MHKRTIHFWQWWRRPSTPPDMEVTMSMVNGHAQLALRRHPTIHFSPKPNRRTHTHRWIQAVCAALILIAAPRVQAAAITGTNIISQTNGVRVEHGLATLVSNDALTAAAQAKADDMIRLQYFNHVSPTGWHSWNWMESAGYHFTAAGENLAMDFVDAADVITAWMGSAGHRKNILSQQFTEVGVATISGLYAEHTTTVVVEFFGSRTTVSKKPSPAQSPTAIAPTTVVQKAPPPVALSISTPLMVPSLIDPHGRPKPTLLFTFQAPSLSAIEAKSPEPQVLGASTSPSVKNLNSALNPALPNLVFLSLILDTAMVLGVGLFLRPRQIPSPSNLAWV